MMQSGSAQPMADLGILHSVVVHPTRGDQQDAPCQGQPQLVTPVAHASTMFLAYIPCLDRYMEIDALNIGAGPSTAPPLPTPHCIWLEDAWRPFEKIQDNLHPSQCTYAQMAGQAPPAQVDPAPLRPAVEFSLLVFGPHPRHTTLQSVRFKLTQLMRLTTPSVVVPLLAGRWHQQQRSTKRPGQAAACFTLESTLATSVTAQQEQQLSQLLRQQHRWRCVFLKNKEAVHHKKEVPTVHRHSRHRERSSSPARQLGLELLQQGQPAHSTTSTWQLPRVSQRIPKHNAEHAVASLVLQNRFAALTVATPTVAGPALGLAADVAVHPAAVDPVAVDPAAIAAVDHAAVVPALADTVAFAAVGPAAAPPSISVALPDGVTGLTPTVEEQQQNSPESERCAVGRGGLRRRANRRISRAQRGLVVASLNARGLCDLTQGELQEVLDSEGIDILAIQESWEGQYVVRNLRGYRWYGKPRDDKRGGVGFYIHASLANTLQIYTKTNCAESIWLKIKGTASIAALCIGCVYMPDSGKPAAQRKAAFESLQADLGSFKRKGEVVLCGDFNARVGKGNHPNEHVGMYGEALDVKDSGKLLRKMLGDHSMYTLNGRIACPTPEYTWEEQSQRTIATVIDYILVQASTFFGPARPTFKVRNDLDGSITSDHKLLWAELPRQAKRSQVRNSPSRKVFRVEKFTDPDTENSVQAIRMYQECLQGHVSEFETFVEETYQQHNILGAQKLVRERFHTLVEAAAEESIGSKQVVPGKSKTWWSPEITIAITQRRNAYATFRAEGSMVAWQEYKRKRERVHSLVKAAKSMFTDNADKTICNAYDECQTERKTRMGDKTLWNAFNSAYRPKKTQDSAPTLLRKADGSYACGDRGIALAFGEHYEKLGSSDTLDQGAEFDKEFEVTVRHAVADYIKVSHSIEGAGIEELDTDLTTREIARARLSLKNGKCGSPLESTSAELLKYGGRAMDAMLHCLYSKAWEHECTFQRPGVIVSIFKKGDKEDANNYRGITLLSVVDKVYTKIINNRLAHFAEVKNLLHNSQNGFRPQRSCTDHIWTLHAVTSGRMRAGAVTYALFVDVVKAFPSVWRDGLWYRLWHMGIKGKMFRILYHLYDTMSRCAWHNNETSNYFVGDLGLGEGDPLSPLLYTLFVNGLLQEVWEKHPGVPLPTNPGGNKPGTTTSEPESVSDTPNLVALMLADDLVGVADTEEEIKLMAQTIHKYSCKWRFQLSPSKSAVVVFGNPPAKKASPKVHFGTSELPVLDAYRYLGVVFSKDCKWDSHIASVIDKAVTSVNMLSDFFGNRRVKFGVKRAMLLALIRPGVEYASEVWWASSHQAASLESKIQIEVLKRSLHCKPNICHEILRAEVGIRPLSSWLDQRKVEWWYKLNHKSHDSLCRQAFDAHWHSQRNYMSWHKHVAALMNSLGMMQEGEYAKLDLPLQGFRSYLRWCIYERDATTRDNLAKSKSTLASYIQHYNEAINYLQPQPYLCTNLLNKGMELILQMRAGVLPLHSMTARFNTRSGSQQAEREECKSCALGEMFGPGEAETPEHFMLDCPAYHTIRKDMWERLKLVPEIAAKVRILEGKLEKEKLHCMLDEKFWGVNIDEESGSVEGPFVHAFDCVSKYVSSAWALRNRYVHGYDDDDDDELRLASDEELRQASDVSNDELPS